MDPSSGFPMIRAKIYWRSIGKDSSFNNLGEYFHGLVQSRPTANSIESPFPENRLREKLQASLGVKPPVLSKYDYAMGINFLSRLPYFPENLDDQIMLNILITVSSSNLELA